MNAQVKNEVNECYVIEKRNKEIYHLQRQWKLTMEDIDHCIAIRTGNQSCPQK